MRLKQCIFALVAMLLCAFSANAQVTTEAALKEALTTGGEVTLGADINVAAQIEIPAGKTVVLDLAGYEIVGGWNGSSTTNHIYVLSNRGTLTIKDSGTEGKIVSRGIYNYGELILESGTIDACDGNGGYAVNNESGSTFIMNGGVVSASYEDGDAPTTGNYDATALDVPAGCTATLNGGKITSVTNYTYAISLAGELIVPETSTVEVTGAHGAISISAGSADIAGGTFICSGVQGQTDNVVYVSGGSMDISGGTFEGDSDGASGGCCVCDLAGGATINGGSFSKSSGGDVCGTTGSTTINGGTFENLTETQHVAVGATITNAGKTYTKTENGTMEETTFVAKIGSTTYATFAETLTAASAMSGDVTIEVYDKVTLNTAFSGSYSSINFVGKDTDAEIYLDVQGYITATGKKVSFTDLTLSKSAGVYITNAGFMNVAFGIYDVTEVAYTNCVFANGAYASSGNVTFNDCTFYRSYDKYGLWAYGNVDVAVEGCTFADYRGIKMYAEGAAKTVDLTVKNTDFSALTGKPAIVLTYGESVVLEGNTYSSTGTFELDLDGAPNGTAVTSDVAPTCKNDNGTCGVLVDGKIYTTAAQAAAVAAEGSNVTLLYSTTDAVEFAEGVNLTLANGVTADNVTVATSAVAKIGETSYATLAEAIAAAESGATITLMNGEHELPAFSNKELTFVGESKDGVIVNDAPDARAQGWNGSTFHFENLTAKGATANYHGLANGVVAVTYKNCNINGLRFLYANTVSFEDCAFKAEGVEHSFWTYGASKVTVKNSTFTYTDRAVNCYSENGADHETDITFEGCSFTYAGTNDAPEGAVEINSGSSKSIDLAMNNCTAPEKGAMWFNSQWDSKNGENTVVSVDGEIVWQVVNVELPEVEITDIKGSLTDSDPDLTFALNFTIKDLENLDEEYLNKVMEQYGSWYTDYVLTISGLTDENVTFNANGDSDGYLAGQYDGFGPNWVSVPFENVTLANNESIYIMEYAEKLMGQSGLRYTLAEIVSIVMDFDCGVYFTPEFLTANPGLKVDLHLKVFTEDAEGNKVNDINVATNNFDVEDYVAIVHATGKQTTYCTTLADAVAAAEADEKITLIADVELTETLNIPAGKEVVLDLNGKTISQTKEQTAGYQMILNDGKLTINDSSEAKTGKISYTDSGNGGEYISDVIYNRSVLVINGGTIENLSSATVASNGYPHTVDTYSGIRDTYVEINGGTIYCAEYSAIRMFCVSATNKADLVINGGTIKGAIDMQNGTKNLALGTLTINDGTFETTKNANNIRFANWNGGATEYGISAAIKGGSFNGGITTAYVPAAANWDKGVITGGTFAKDMTEYCAEGFVCEANIDGTYGIVADPSYIAELTIDDANPVDYTSDLEGKTVGKLTYKRSLIGGIWNPFFIPFEIDIERLVNEFGLEVAYYNQMISTENADGGFDYKMEVKHLTSGVISHYPLFVKVATDTEIEYVAEDVVLGSADEFVITTSSVTNTFKLYGTHQAKSVSDLEGKYAINALNGQWTPSTSGIKPHRLYFEIQENNNNPFSSSPAKSIGIVVRGEEGFTGIEEVTGEANENVIFDLQGRRILEPQKGELYIINGKKVIY